MSNTRTTVRTIERGVRVSSKSRSSRERAGSSSGGTRGRSGSPIDLLVKQQVHAFIDHSAVEKSELGKLNDRMCTYVDRVKALECENTKLMHDIGELQLHWGDETRAVRDAYEQNLFDARGRIDDVANLKTIADVRNKRAQYENAEYQKRCDDTVRLNDTERSKIKQLERELAQARDNGDLLKRSIADEIQDIDKYRQTRDDTWTQLIDLLDKLDDELYRRIQVEYTNQTLREHIEFVKQVNEKELAEMSQLGEALPFNDQIEFYKDQLKRVISNIRKDYEQLHQEQTREMEEWMRLKSEEMAAKAREKDPIHELELEMQLENIEGLRDAQDVNAKELDALRLHHDMMSRQLEAIEKHAEIEKANLSDTLAMQNGEIAKLNDDLGALLNDYNHINANKATLEYEMQVYKRLLDSQLGERSSSSSSAASALVSASISREAHLCITETAPPANQTSVTSNAFGGKVQNKKEKKGTIGIADSSPDGKFIVIENVGNSSAQIDLSGWLIRRKVDGNTEITYKIPSGVLLPSNKELTIWASSYSQQRSGVADLVAAELENWGIGINSVSKLISAGGEEKSSFYQQITFSSRY